MEYCIETIGLTKTFGAKTALNEMSLKIPTGGIHSIVGSNGAGKSTLFRLLLGVISPTKGDCRLLGEDCQDLSPEVRGRVGYVNEEHTLPLWMTPRTLTNMQKTYYPQWGQSIYENVLGHFDVDPNQKISGLSRGERAGLNLSIALAQNPEVLILDEPTLGLDVVAKQSFLEALMFTETEMNSTVIYCSHQMEEIERVSDNIIIFEKGVVKNFSSPADFCNRIRSWVVNFTKDIPQSADIPGFLSIRNIEGQSHIMVVDQGEGFSNYLSQNGGENAQMSSVNLDRAVNAFLAKNHNKPTK